VIVVNQVGVKLSLSDGESEIDDDERYQQCPGCLEPVGLAQQKHEDKDKPSGNTAQ
jgi:hypothetical protein